MGSALVSNNENPKTGAIDTKKTMVVLSLEEYSKLTDSVEIALDKADKLAAENTERMSHEDLNEKITYIAGKLKISVH